MLPDLVPAARAGIVSIGTAKGGYDPDPRRLWAHKRTGQFVTVPAASLRCRKALEADVAVTAICRVVQTPAQEWRIGRQVDAINRLATGSVILGEFVYGTVMEI